MRPAQHGDRDEWSDLMASAFLAPRPAVASGFTVPGPLRVVATAVSPVAGRRLIGAAELGGVAVVPPGAMSVRVAVVPGWRSRGVGQALAGALLAGSGDRVLATSVADDDERSRRVAERAGFAVYEHSEGFELDLGRAATRPAPPAGLAIHALPATPSKAEWSEAYDIFVACCADTPDLHGAIPAQPAWRELLASFPPAAALGRIEGRPACCSFAVPAGAARWQIVMTGVAPRWRRQGLGVAVKVALERQARAYGVRWLRTNSLASNHSIRALNRALGYEPVPGVWRLRREPSGP